MSQLLFVHPLTVLNLTCDAPKVIPCTFAVSHMSNTIYKPLEDGRIKVVTSNCHLLELSPSNQAIKCSAALLRIVQPHIRSSFNYHISHSKPLGMKVTITLQSRN